VAASVNTALLDVEFKDDLVGYRSGHGAKNIPIVRASRSVACVPTKSTTA